MTNQQREIARILTDEIHFDPTEGPTFGRAIERLVERERAVSHQEFNRLREWFGLASEERGKAFGRGMIYMAKWAGAALILITVGIVAVMSKKPIPANVEEQLQDTINIGHPRLDGPATTAQIRFVAGTNRRMYVVWNNAWDPDTTKHPYYFNDSACLTHPGPQIVISQKQYLDTVAAGTTLYVDSAKANDSVWVYVFGATDTLIRVDTLPKTVNVNKL